MANYLFIYHGGKMPETQEEGQQVMAQWQAWFAELGDAVIDGGNPVGPSSTVHTDGSVSADGGSNPTSGYSIIAAKSQEEANGSAQRCPVLSAGGSVEVAAIVNIEQ